MFDGASNVQLVGDLLKNLYPMSTVIRVFEHTVSLFFNDLPKIPISDQIIRPQKAIYNLFGSGIYHNPHNILKSKYYEYHNKNNGLFSGNDTILARYFTIMHRDLRMIKLILVIISSAEF